MKRLLPRPARDDAGMTITELSVAMMLTGIVATITFAALISSQKTMGRIDDENQGLSDLRVVEERLSRDLRAARGVEASPVSTTNVLVVWIDSNADYRRTDPEIITWRIVPGAKAGQFDVLRANDAGTEQVLGRSVVSDVAFRYAGPDTGGVLAATATARSNRVAVTFSYDAVPGQYSTVKTVGFEIRLRNMP